ncbi:uncharacterized protein O3C94_023399 isoform 2-T2 [Discoglossus pictus]
MDALQLRRLRKKLRQIEVLEHLPRALTSTESAKVSQKLELRSLLEDLLSQHVIPKDMITEAVPVDSAPSSLQPASSKAGDEPRDPDPLPLKTSRFRVRSFEGHSDLVTCLLIQGTTVISGSWDTSVRVWDLSSCSELKTLCGHTGEVLCLSHISEVGVAAILQAECQGSSQLSHDDHLVSSGSSDCSIRVWNLRTGLAVLSIYTFSAVSALAHIPDTSLLVSGSDGGKVEVWDLQSRESQQSERAHGESVTVLQVRSGLVFSGSAEGSVKIWRISSLGKLSLVHSCDALSRSLRSLRSFCVIGDRLYLATQGLCVKVVDWKQDRLTRLSNHILDSGFVDAVAVTPDGQLIASGFNIDQGNGYLNFRHGNTGCYLSTLSHPDAPRLLCVSVSKSHHCLRLVTGGRDMLLWEEQPEGAATGDGLTQQLQFSSAFMNTVPETESEEEEEETSLWETDTETPHTAPQEPEQPSWCVLL